MNQITIYTDGGCRPNPGKGAYAFVALDEKEQIVEEYSNSLPNVTNNMMELQATLSALSWAHRHHPGIPVVLVADSQYVQKGITEWIYKWKRNGWRTGDGSAVKNQDLWFALDQLTDLMPSLTFEWVKGHADSRWNNHVDALCGTHFGDRPKKTALSFTASNNLLLNRYLNEKQMVFHDPKHQKPLEDFAAWVEEYFQSLTSQLT